MFSLLVSEILSSHMIDTFDVWPESAKAAAFLNEHIGGVNFTLGDSRDTLSLHEGTADFAWIDGDHEGDGPLRDLLNCFRLRVPYVAVDDTNEPAVGAAVREVITRGMFEEVPNPFAAHDKRKAVLLHIREARECA
jgi:hypothetical protein